MSKARQKNNYQEFLKKKRCFDEKVKQGMVFKDSDCDGLSDYEEKNIYCTDPNNPDTDGDGVKDGNEVKQGRNPLGSGKLRDLFIPHAGNNYLPQSLRTNRLLFHAISVVTMKAIVVIFILFYPLSAWLRPDMALAEAKKVIELTNNLRRAAALPALSENRRLAQAAWQKVEDMALNQYFAHISPNGLGLKNWLIKVGYKYSIAGENLAVGFSGAEDVVEAWKNSPTHYNNIIDADFKEIGVALADGKLSQIDTIFVAQYFGTPKTPSLPEDQASTTKESAKNQKITVAPPTVKKITPKKAPLAAGEKIATTTLSATEKAAGNEIIIDQSATTLSVKNDQFNKEKSIQITATLPDDTVSAEVIINNHKLILTPVAGEANRWSGTTLIDQNEEKDILNPLISAGVAVNNSAGETNYGELDWDKATVIKASPYEHYRLFKDYPAASMKPIIKISDSYFKLILLIAIISLFLNIFIEIKKQHPRAIFYSFAFLALLSAVIIF